MLGSDPTSSRASLRPDRGCYGRNTEASDSGAVFVTSGLTILRKNRLAVGHLEGGARIPAGAEDDRGPAPALLTLDTDPEVLEAAVEQ